MLLLLLLFLLLILLFDVNECFRDILSVRLIAGFCYAGVISI